MPVLWGMLFFPGLPQEEKKIPLQKIIRQFDRGRKAEEALREADRRYREKAAVSDSLCRIAFRYYESRGASPELARLHFYRGKYAEAMNRKEEALLHYTKAKDLFVAFPHPLLAEKTEEAIAQIRARWGEELTENIQWKFRYESLLAENAKLVTRLKTWRGFTLAAFCLLAGLLFFFRYRTLQRRRELFESQLLIERLQRAEEELKEKMSWELNEKDSKLKDFFQLRVEMIKKFVEFSQKYGNNPEKLKDKFQRTISTDSFSPADWALLREGVNITGNGILDYLEKTYPELTEENLRYCALICAGFETDELAILWDINSDSIYKRRTRLRHKLGLSKNQDLKKFFDEQIARLR